MDSFLGDDAALFVIDMQNDFIGGSLPVYGADEIIPTVNFWIEVFEDLERPILYSLDWHPKSTPHFDRWPVHCVEGTVGARIHDDVIYEPTTMDKVYTVLKGLGQDDGYSACSRPSEVFSQTKTGRIHTYGSVGTALATEGVGTVIVVGVATEYCVKATVLDLLTLGLKVVVSLDAIRPVSFGDGVGALFDMGAAGALFMRGEEILPALDIPMAGTV